MPMDARSNRHDAHREDRALHDLTIDHRRRVLATIPKRIDRGRSARDRCLAVGPLVGTIGSRRARNLLSKGLPLFDGRQTMQARNSFHCVVALCVTALASGLMAAESDEAVFLREAIEGHLAEISLGDLAAQRAERADVREFGKRLRDDHAAAVKRATAVAKSRHVEAPIEPTSEAERHYDGLAQLSGGRFDAAFLSYMVVAHEAEIARYSRNASSDDDGLASLVAEALPTLRAHLSLAQALQRGPVTTR